VNSHPQPHIPTPTKEKEWLTSPHPPRGVRTPSQRDVSGLELKEIQWKRSSGHRYIMVNGAGLSWIWAESFFYLGGVARLWVSEGVGYYVVGFRGMQTLSESHTPFRVIECTALAYASPDLISGASEIGPGNLRA
jgi:hypothetical protein